MSGPPPLWSSLEPYFFLNFFYLFFFYITFLFGLFSKTTRELVARALTEIFQTQAELEKGAIFFQKMFLPLVHVYVGNYALIRPYVVSR